MTSHSKQEEKQMQRPCGGNAVGWFERTKAEYRREESSRERVSEDEICEVGGDSWAQVGILDFSSKFGGEPVEGGKSGWER